MGTLLGREGADRAKGRDAPLDPRNPRSRSNALTVRRRHRCRRRHDISITPPKNRAHAQPTRHAHYPFPRTTVSELTPVNSVLQTRLPRPRSRIHISPHSHRPSTELECQTPYLAPIKVPAAVVQLFTSPRFIQDISPHLYTLGANSTRETVYLL